MTVLSIVVRALRMIPISLLKRLTEQEISRKNGDSPDNGMAKTDEEEKESEMELSKGKKKEK